MVEVPGRIRPVRVAGSARQADRITGWIGGSVAIALPEQDAEEDEDEAAGKGKGAGEVSQASTIASDAVGKVLSAVIAEKGDSRDGQRGAASNGKRHGNARADEAPAPGSGKADNGAAAWADTDGDNGCPRAEGRCGGGIVMMVVMMAAGAVCVMPAARAVAVEDVGADSDDEGSVGAV